MYHLLRLNQLLRSCHGTAAVKKKNRASQKLLKYVITKMVSFLGRPRPPLSVFSSKVFSWQNTIDMAVYKKNISIRWLFSISNQQIGRKDIPKQNMNLKFLIRTFWYTQKVTKGIWLFCNTQFLQLISQTLWIYIVPPNIHSFLSRRSPRLTFTRWAWYSWWISISHQCAHSVYQ